MQTVVKVSGLVQQIAKKVILNGLSFEVFEGECFGLFGTRGTGKTSLLHILAGIDRFKSGSVEVLGCDVRKSERFKQRLGLVTQERSLFTDVKAIENLHFIAVLKNGIKKNIPLLVDQFEIKDFLNEPAGSLEPGILQRLSMACALLNSPALLIVDDFIKDIDLYSRHVILRELERFLSGGGTCLRGFSNIELCEQMSRVGWLENGQIAVFSPEDARENWNSRTKVLTQGKK